MEIVCEDRGQVTINGEVFNGRTICITDDKVIVDGKNHKLPNGKNNTPTYYISIDGDTKTIEVTNSKNTTIRSSGSISDLRIKNGDVKCGNVLGNISSEIGDVECASVGGCVITKQGDVDCGDVRGSVYSEHGDISA